MCGNAHETMEGCRCRGGRLRGFIQPRLLLQLAQKPAHGYELLDLFERFDEETSPDPGSLYRTLRALEEEGFVCSNWNTSGSGPARRIYSLTDQGIEYLHAWAVNLRKVRQNLDRFLAEYETHFSNERKSEHVSSL